MKKIFSLMIVLIVAISLAACASQEKDSTVVKPTELEPPTNVSGEGEPMTPEEIEYYLAKIEANLTKERTGKELEPASLANFRKFAEGDDGKPFYMVNLIRENDEPKYPDNWTGERAKTVQEAKGLYSKACYPILGKMGAYSITGVTYTSPAVVSSVGDVGDWDQFYLVAYPSRKAFIDLLASDAYADAVVHKYAGDKDTVLIPVTAGEINSKEAFSDSKPLTDEEIDNYLSKIEANLTKERTGKELEPASLANFREFAEGDDGKPFYMVNLIRENDEPKYPDNWTGERAKSVQEAKGLYSKACYPILGKMGAYSITGVTYTSPAVVSSVGEIGDWDQFYLVAYPSRKAFIDLLASDLYADAVVHKYAGDKDTLLIPVTAGEITYKN